ncbi:hypothetical protein KSS87_009860 [Heliosperma pusillum]|nr:hypothetical protein KSS87_009860 [Heliosperma pusillum]
MPSTAQLPPYQATKTPTTLVVTTTHHDVGFEERSVGVRREGRGRSEMSVVVDKMVVVKMWAELLNTFCTTGKLELELIYKVQVQCYEDAKLMKLFPEIVRSLYDQDVLAEDTILHWFRKGTNPKGRQTFVKSLEPFIKWLEEAEEEEE